MQVGRLQLLMDPHHSSLGYNRRYGNLHESKSWTSTPSIRIGAREHQVEAPPYAGKS